MKPIPFQFDKKSIAVLAVSLSIIAGIPAFLVFAQEPANTTKPQAVKKTKKTQPTKTATNSSQIQKEAVDTVKDAVSNIQEVKEEAVLQTQEEIQRSQQPQLQTTTFQTPEPEQEIISYTIQSTESSEMVVPESEETTQSEKTQTWTGPVLSKAAGVNIGPSGKETYYNLPMEGVISLMRSAGFSEAEYPYWVREDGVKMFGEYVMIAAELSSRPKGSLVPTSLGMGMVCDTGSFALSNPTQIDIAVNW